MRHDLDSPEDIKARQFISHQAEHYRRLVDKGMGSVAIHKELEFVDFGCADKVKPSIVASIINYAFYAGDTNNIRRIMNSGVLGHRI